MHWKCYNLITLAVSDASQICHFDNVDTHSILWFNFNAPPPSTHTFTKNCNLILEKFLTYYICSLLTTWIHIEPFDFSTPTSKFPESFSLIPLAISEIADMPFWQPECKRCLFDSYTNPSIYPESFCVIPSPVPEIMLIHLMDNLNLHQWRIQGVGEEHGPPIFFWYSHSFFLVFTFFKWICQFGQILGSLSHWPPKILLISAVVTFPPPMILL